MKSVSRLRELRATIREEVDYVDIRPYSHNIISLVLMEIDRKYGEGWANKAIRDFGLEELGWKQINWKERYKEMQKKRANESAGQS